MSKAKKKVKKRKRMEYVKRTQKPTVRAPNGQGWTKLSNKFNEEVFD